MTDYTVTQAEREARTCLSVLMETAADFTEADQQNCDHAITLCAKIDSLLSQQGGDRP